MLDFQRPTNGTVRLLGLDSRRDSITIHRRTGYLPGDLQLFPKLTGRDHIDEPGKQSNNVRSVPVATIPAGSLVRHSSLCGRGNEHDGAVRAVHELVSGAPQDKVV